MAHMQVSTYTKHTSTFFKLNKDKLVYNKSMSTLFAIHLQHRIVRPLENCIPSFQGFPFMPIKLFSAQNPVHVRLLSYPTISDLKK